MRLAQLGFSPKGLSKDIFIDCIVWQLSHRHLPQQKKTTRTHIVLEIQHTEACYEHNTM